MLVNCHQKCRRGKITTTVSIDKDTDTVVCDFCNDEIPVTEFVKRQLKQEKKFAKKIKILKFKCLTCKDDVQVTIVNDEPKGLNCKNKCKFNLTNLMINVLKGFEKDE